MLVHDPLYGSVEIPEYLTDLVLSPEVQRLSLIRLINCPSPSLAALGDVRRFSHTLGVLLLSRHCQKERYTREEWRAFEASILLHDIGTPPFGHLVEYHLREHQKAGWNHEEMIAAVLRGTHAPENRVHQIFAKRTIRFINLLEEEGISRECVEAIVTQKHPLSRLLFGTIDLDNLDNVARMAWALGEPAGAHSAVALASGLQVERDGKLVLEERAGREAIKEWAKLRRFAYNVLVFDPMAAAAQAVLSEAIGNLVQQEQICPEDWTLTDEQLIDRLQQHPCTKDAITLEFFGRPPALAFCIHIQGSLSGLGLSGRAAVKVRIESILRDEFKTERVLGYSIIDHGTFEKRVGFKDPCSQFIWEEGVTSSSVILYGFIRSKRPAQVSRCKRAADLLIEELGVTQENIKSVRIGNTRKAEDAQPAFAFATA